MQLVINTYGSYLKREQGCFVLKNEDHMQKISTRNIDSILVTTGALISSDAIQLALERNIEIFFWIILEIPWVKSGIPVSVEQRMYGAVSSKYLKPKKGQS